MNIWFSYHWHALALAFKRLALIPFSTLLTLGVIGIAFSLPAGIYVFLENVETLSGQFSSGPQLSLFLKLNATQSEVGKIESFLKENPHVASFRFIPKASALEQFKESPGLAGVMDGLEGNPLPDAFVVTARDVSTETLKTLSRALSELRQVEHVQLDSAWTQRLDALLKLGRLAAWMLSVLLSLLVIAVVFNTIRLQILTMGDEIEVAKLIGATNGFIRRPFLYFGTIQGLVGGIVAWLIISLGIHLTDEPVKHLMQLYETDFHLYHLSMGDSLVMFLFSAGLGWLGAWLSVVSHLLKIEPR
ncbi:permease-like cell division protein FtsX [Nitrosospira multiformis]|uniref:Cell division protein FtsX n=1 Tax=Nitrosospira multiformis TaxID=1231 RepID=A0A1I7HKT2_9PROT|nr:permease-like cell division protein FtsX [Nitrosospira multiformis]SFU61278.1 cell division protein FtsX [Nitrosospira multiformis]